MNWLKTIQSRFRALFAKRELDADMDDEMRSHIEMRTQQNMESGMNPEEARGAALRQFGWAESIKETCREQRGVTWLENLAQDIRYGARQLCKNPGFTTVAVLTLALGIRANTAIFSVISAVLLRPLPFREPDRLVMLWEQDRKGSQPSLVAGATFLAWREQSSSFEQMGFWPEWRGSQNFLLTGSDESELVHGAFISSSLPPLLGVQPMLGRSFRPEEDHSKDSQVVLLSHGLWQRRFGGNTNILGKSITLDNYWRRQYRVVGVMPPGFQFSEQSEIWLPAGLMEVGLTNS